MGPPVPPLLPSVSSSWVKGFRFNAIGFNVSGDVFAHGQRDFLRKCLLQTRTKPFTRTDSSFPVGIRSVPPEARPRPGCPRSTPRPASLRAVPLQRRNHLLHDWSEMPKQIVTSRSRATDLEHEHAGSNFSSHEQLLILGVALPPAEAAAYRFPWR